MISYVLSLLKVNDMPVYGQSISALDQNNIKDASDYGQYQDVKSLLTELRKLEQEQNVNQDRALHQQDETQIQQQFDEELLLISNNQCNSSEDCQQLPQISSPSNVEEDFADHVHCDSLGEKHDCLNEIKQQSSKPSNNQALILSLFGGSTLILLLTYMLMNYFKYLKKKKSEAKESEPDMETLQKDYEEFKKLKLMELKAIEKEKHDIQNKKNSRKSSKSGSKKSFKSAQKAQAAESQPQDKTNGDIQGNTGNMNSIVDNSAIKLNDIDFSEKKYLDLKKSKSLHIMNQEPKIVINVSNQKQQQTKTDHK